jgi:hypothetical protein
MHLGIWIDVSINALVLSLSAELNSDAIASWIGEHVAFKSEWTAAVLALGPKASEPL